MRSCLLSLFLSFVFIAAKAQLLLDSVQLRTIKGTMTSFAAVTQKDSIVLICFWSVNSEASIGAMNAVNARYPEWKKTIPFRMMAVCTDEGNLANRMKSTANMNDWTFDVFGDINGDLRNALNAGNPPEAIILRKGKVAYRQNGFEPGSENYLISRIKSFLTPRL